MRRIRKGPVGLRFDSFARFGSTQTLERQHSRIPLAQLAVKMDCHSVFLYMNIDMELRKVTNNETRATAHCEVSNADKR